MDFSKDFSGPLRGQEKGTGTWGQGVGIGAGDTCTGQKAYAVPSRMEAWLQRGFWL